MHPVDAPAVRRRRARSVLTVEVAEDEAFRRVVATAPAPVSAAAGLDVPRARRGPEAGRAPTGIASPTRTETAAASAARSPRPRRRRPRPVNFAFVSCQNVNEGTLNAYRRMIFEDERAAPPTSSASCCTSATSSTRSSGIPRTVEDTLRPHDLRGRAAIPDGEKIGNFHFPPTVDDYRAVYHGYLHDPDLQDARARWPFVSMWDNHEFSWQGWQSIVKAGGVRAARPDASRSPPTRRGSSISRRA